jgi:hypothetical protein
LDSEEQAIVWGRAQASAQAKANHFDRQPKTARLIRLLAGCLIMPCDLGSSRLRRSAGRWHEEVPAELAV